MSTIRRYDIDWLRVIAIWLLMFYHLAIAFQSYGVFIGFIQNEETMASLQMPIALLNIWRIPILFYISGMGVCFAMRKRDWKTLLKERARRILLPFVFGMLTIVPLHILLWQRYYSQDLAYLPSPGHLWFLGNIFVYVLVLSPLFFYLKRNADGKVSQVIKKVFGSPLGIPIIMVVFVIEAVLVNPDIFELYALTPHGFFLGLLAFLFGYLTIFVGEKFWQQLLQLRWLLLIGTIALFMVRWMVFDLKAPNYLMVIESNFWIFTLFAFGYKYLNIPGKYVTYLSTASYPVYILHMFFQYLGSAIFFPMALATPLKFLIVLIFTVAGCYITYEFVIKRIFFLRPLFGLRNK